jgi:DNA helicase HerA-like ATPase
MKDRVIGKVSATEKFPSTTDEFYFWTDKGEILSPFDVVKVKHLPNNETITYGIIEEINHVTDAANHFTSYISNDFGDKNEIVGNMNRLGINYVKARVVCNTNNIYSPVLDGNQVFLCNKEDIQIALGLKNVKNPIVCGYLEMYRGEEQQRIKVELNANFLIGPEGAHLNVSGISGLAAKTSYSMFLLNAIQQKLCIENKEDIAFVFFNVKGRDLLAIDELNEDLKAEDKNLYKELDLKDKPFENVKYYYPYYDSKPERVSTCASIKDVKKQKSKNKAFCYKFPLASGFNDKSIEKIDLLLANEEDSTGTMESCVNHIINRQSNFKNVERWDTLIEEIEKNALSNSKSPDKKEILPSSWKKFLRIIKKAVDTHGIFNDDLAKDEIDLTQEIRNNLKGGDVMVIDMTLLDDLKQSFVFGNIARAIWDMKFDTERDNIPKKVIIFVDELNKYASSDTPKNSPILKQLLDITERGRSLGIILFSVEQFRSAIHDRVKGNCATSAYGRTNAIEVSKSDYRFIPKVYQNMMTRLPAGEYIISNPALRSLINIKFPYNTYKQFPNG